MPTVGIHAGPVRRPPLSTATIAAVRGDTGQDPKLGLPSEVARARLVRFGFNELPPAKPDLLSRRVARQFAEPMAFLLISAAAVTWLGLGKRVDAMAILTIVLANVLIALIQEGKAASALQALKSMESPKATVRRDGNAMHVGARELVPGDVVVLAAGDRVPADVRVLESTALEADESMLTGESLPVGKRAASPGEAGFSPVDQETLLFAGTHVVRGSGLGTVVATGPRTELGAIAAHLQEREPATPLQRELRKLSSRLGLIAVVIALGVFGATLLRIGATDGGIEIAFLTAAALAVAAVPEGLPTVVTVALTLGVRRMAGRGSIVRRLPAVETLGSTTVILTDKTGTLTENRMIVASMWVSGGVPKTLAELPPRAAARFAEVIALCNDATLDPPTGDSTEVALLEGIGERPERIRIEHPRIDAVPFDSERRWMLTANAFGSETGLFAKGAPEVILECSTKVWNSRGDLEPLSTEHREHALAQAEELARHGARVLAVARRTIPGVPISLENEEHDFEFVGLVTLRDPIRPAAARAVSDAAAAGIRILMVTGDHPGTAVAVAREVGLASERSTAVVGADIRRHGLPVDPLEVPVYARVSPDEKLALTRTLQDRGHIVAVTGDGVNDAPALRRADIGVAMGRSGSDVAREAADMVVTDDNLATIVDAVREGRGIYDNIRKVVEYLVAGNLSEIFVVVGGLLFFPGLGVPLLPLQLLWINLITDGFPALALGVDAVDPALMARAPRSRKDHLLSSERLARLLARGLLIAAAALGSLAIARYAWDEPWSHARASMFSVLMTAHLLYAFAVRRSRSNARSGMNVWLTAAVLGGLLLQAVVVSVPQLQSLFGTASLSVKEWGLVAVAGSLPALLIRTFAPRS